MKRYTLFVIGVITSVMMLLVSCGSVDNPLESIPSSGSETSPAASAATSLSIDTSTSLAQENAE